jgi:hypothetical protein
MSSTAELHILRARVAELEATVDLIDRGQMRQEEKLRDRLAGMAMAAFIEATSDHSGTHPQNDDSVALRAYEMADAMLLARGEKPCPQD